MSESTDNDIGLLRIDNNICLLGLDCNMCLSILDKKVNKLTKKLLRIIHTCKYILQSSRLR